MARKVILDVDPGVDDALALSFALFHPGLDVVAVTAVGGNCSPANATRNLQAIVEALDPPRLPRLGERRSPNRKLACRRKAAASTVPTGLAGPTCPWPSGSIFCRRKR